MTAPKIVIAIEFHISSDKEPEISGSADLL